jgi:uncharacterized protein YcbK (DUF882 family)
MFSRRNFLKKSAVAAGGIIASQSELFADYSDRKVLKLHNVHLNKTFYASFFEKNYYKLNGLFEVNKAFMDYRAREMIKVDLELVNLLYNIQSQVGSDRAFNVLSGYRSPSTNNMLRRRSEGVAKNSYHMKGQAVDISVPGVPVKEIRDMALSFKSGGVGYYPSSGFVHVDVGPVRTWRRG